MIFWPSNTTALESTDNNEQHSTRISAASSKTLAESATNCILSSSADQKPSSRTVMPAAGVFSLLTFFRLVKKASRLSGRDPTVLKITTLYRAVPTSPACTPCFRAPSSRHAPASSPSWCGGRHRGTCHRRLRVRSASHCFRIREID